MSVIGVLTAGGDCPGLNAVIRGLVLRAIEENDSEVLGIQNGWEGLMDGERAALWIHGHMHESSDYEIYGTRVVCNPRGYAPNALTPDFQPYFVVEI